MSKIFIKRIYYPLVFCLSLLVGCNQQIEIDKPKNEVIPHINFKQSNLKGEIVEIDDYTYGVKISWKNRSGHTLRLIREESEHKNILLTSNKSETDFLDDNCPYDADVNYFLEHIYNGNSVSISKPIKIKIPRIEFNTENDIYFSVSQKEYDWNKYVVNVSWSLPFDDDFALVKTLYDKEFNQYEELIRIPINKPNNQFLNDLVKAGNIYRYTIVYNGIRRFDQEFQVAKEIKIPDRVRQLVLSDTIKLSEIKDLPTYTHLLLKKNAHIFTNGQDLMLNIRSLKSEGATITTFGAGSKANDNSKGKDGGSITINTHSASGNLHVELRGQHAGDRTNEPPTLGEAYRGAKGSTGSRAQHECPLIEPRIFNFKAACFCTNQPGNGGPGHQGATGSKGYKGLSGGNSGDLTIKIKNQNDFNITFERETGIGSQGSIGGVGGPGGHGGNAGEHARGCGGASQGSPGPRGSRGAKGDNGDDGVIGKACLTLSLEEDQICF